MSTAAAGAQGWSRLPVTRTSYQVGKPLGCWEGRCCRGLHRHAHGRQDRAGPKQLVGRPRRARAVDVGRKRTTKSFTAADRAFWDGHDEPAVVSHVDEIFSACPRRRWTAFGATIRNADRRLSSFTITRPSSGLRRRRGSLVEMRRGAPSAGSADRLPRRSSVKGMQSHRQISTQASHSDAQGSRKHRLDVAVQATPRPSPSREL